MRISHFSHRRENIASNDVENPIIMPDYRDFIFVDQRARREMIINQTRKKSWRIKTSTELFSFPHKKAFLFYFAAQQRRYLRQQVVVIWVELDFVCLRAYTRFSRKNLILVVWSVSERVTPNFCGWNGLFAFSLLFSSPHAEQPHSRPPQHHPTPSIVCIYMENQQKCDLRILIIIHTPLAIKRKILVFSSSFNFHSFTRKNRKIFVWFLLVEKVEVGFISSFCV